MRFERVAVVPTRLISATLRNWTLRFALLAVLTGLTLGFATIVAVGVDPVEAIRAMVRGAVGSDFARENAATKVAPTILTGLAFLVALKAGLFNIGAEGQLLAGAAAGGATGLYLPDAVPGPVRVPLMLLSAVLAGAIWGGIPGVLRAYLSLNEILTTLLMNSIALYSLGYLVSGPMEDTNPDTVGYPWTPPLNVESRLPELPIGSGITSGLLLAVVFAAVVSALLYRHRIGQDWRVLGASPSSAQFSGISTRRRIVEALAFSGGLAGLAGIVQLAGAQYRLTNFFSQGYGFDGIVVTIVGGLRPIGTVIAGSAFGLLRTGAESMERTAGVPFSVASIMQGFILLFIVCALGTRALRFQERRRIFTE